MDGITIKQEIKEEIQDVLYDTDADDYKEPVLLDGIKFEKDQAEQFNDYDDVYEYHLNNRSGHSSKFNCEKVYVHGEPEVYNPTSHHIENNSDPLALCIAPETTATAASVRRQNASVVYDTHLTIANNQQNLNEFRVVPVKNLVHRTYSKKQKEVPLACTTCKKNFASVSQLRDHGRNCFKCKKCNLFVASMTDLLDHIRKCRRRRKNENQNSSSKVQIRYHTKSTSCNICSLKFLSDEELVEHKRSHLVPNAYACHLCESKFDSEQDAHLHLKNAH